MAKRAKKALTVRAQPLYAQVKAAMLQRIGDGTWAPGILLPSEFQLAAEFDVSQGTVRKALDSLAAENIVFRRQGRGTFITRHDEERALNHFFHLVGDDATRRLPESVLMDFHHEIAEPRECERLSLAKGSRVLRVVRLRYLDHKPVITEVISLPTALVPELGIKPKGDLPSTLHELYQASSNTLYDLYYARYGIVIVKAVEKLRTVNATQEEAEQLGVEPGAALMEIDRVALDVHGRPVEWRLSHVLTRDHFYLSEIE